MGEREREREREREKKRPCLLAFDWMAETLLLLSRQHGT
jgi:hypothetical protein